MEMGGADFNLILNPESRKAAFALEARLGIPYACLLYTSLKIKPKLEESIY